MSGDFTSEAAAGVSRKTLNLSTSRPEVFPQPTTLAASSTVGMFDHTFLGLLQDAECVVPVADHAAHDRRPEIHHRVPRHSHDVGSPLVGGCDQYDRPWLKQTIDLRQGKCSFRHSCAPSSCP